MARRFIEMMAWIRRQLQPGVRQCIGYFVVYLIVALGLIFTSEHVFSEQATIRYYAKILAPVLAKLYDGRISTLALPVSVNGSSNPTATSTHTTRPASASAPAPAPAQDLTTVFLVQDADLEKFDEPYPVRYKFWARRLEQLAEFAPRAVFLDVFFIDKRNDPTLPQFIEQACSMRRAGIPVYIGSLAARGLLTRPEISDARTTAASGASIACFTEVAIPKPIDRFDPSAWEYPLWQAPQTPGPGPAGQARMTVAAQIYQDLGGRVDGVDSESMALIWGARPHPDNAILVSSEANPARALRCDRADPTTLQVMGRFFLRMVTSNKVGKEASADCYYHRTRPMSQLREAEPAELQRIVGGHVVMIAVDVAGLLDYVYSPVANLPVPGVFLHAMALDNLLVFGSDYKRYAELRFFNPALLFAVSVLAVLCLASAILDVYVPVWEKQLGRYQVEPGERPEESTLAAVESTTLANPLLLLFTIFGAVATRLSAWRRRDLPVPASSAALVSVLRQRWHRLLAWVVRNLTIPAFKLCVTLLLSTLIFLIGYAWLDFGPLTWAEFVFFPILCHFLFVGRRVKKMFADTEAALRSSQTVTQTATPPIPSLAPKNPPMPAVTTPYPTERDPLSTPPT